MDEIKIWDMRLQRRWFDAIVFHGKTVEGRKESPRWTGIKIGDIIRFISDEKNNTIKKRVIAVRKYDTITEFLEHEGLIHVLPGIHSIEGGVRDIYKSPPMSWTSEEVSKYGVLAIEFGDC